MEYVDSEDPLEKAKLEADIKKLLEIAEHYYTAEDTSSSPDEHKMLMQLFDLYQEHRQTNDPLERAKSQAKLNEWLRGVENTL